MPYKSMLGETEASCYKFKNRPLATAPRFFNV
jgi:hypothetical protein